MALGAWFAIDGVVDFSVYGSVKFDFRFRRSAPDWAEAPTRLNTENGNRS